MSGIKSSNDQNLHDPESHDPEIWYGSDIIWIPDLNDQNVDDPNDRLSLHDWFDNSVGLERATDTNSNENRRNTVEEQTLETLEENLKTEMSVEDLVELAFGANVLNNDFGVPSFDTTEEDRKSQSSDLSMENDKIKDENSKKREFATST